MSDNDVGRGTDNEQMKLEGEAKEMKELAQQEAAKAGERFRGQFEVTKGKNRQKANR